MWPGIPKLPKLKSLIFLCNILRKKCFWHAGKHENLQQTDTMILMWMIKRLQSSQNSRFAMSLQYVKKEVRDEVDFLPVNKHQSDL